MIAVKLVNERIEWLVYDDIELISCVECEWWKHSFPWINPDEDRPHLPPPIEDPRGNIPIFQQSALFDFQSETFRDLQ